MSLWLRPNSGGLPTATLRDLIEDLGPAVPPEVAVAIARGLLARMEDGPFDDVPPAPRPESVEVEMLGGAVSVRALHRVDLAGVGTLLYEMLAGGPVHVAKDRKGAPPRPLAKLREFLVGGPPLASDLVAFVEDLIAGSYPSVDRAIDALDAVEREIAIAEGTRKLKLREGD